MSGLLTLPQLEVITSDQPKTLFLCGQGGGKTFSAGELIDFFINEFPGVIGFVGANTYMQLSDSTLVEIKRVLSESGITEYDVKGNPDGRYTSDKYPPDHWPQNHPKFKTPHNKWYFDNGCVVFTGSLDNYKAHQGKTIGWAILDETADTKEEAVKDVITGRLRAPGIYVKPDHKKTLNRLFEKGGEFKDLFPFTSDPGTAKKPNRAINPLYILTSPSKVMWLVDYFDLNDYEEQIESKIYSENDYYVGNHGSKKIIVASSFHNEPNLRPGYIQDRMDGLTDEQIRFHVYGSPFAKSGQEYVSTFEKLQHVRPVSYEPGEIHFTVDFNVNPYMSGSVWQLVSKSAKDEGEQWNGYDHWHEARCIKEYTLQYPRNSAGHLGDQFLSDWEHSMLQYGFFVYGDASGKNKLPVKGTKSYFDDLIFPFKHFMYHHSLRVPKANPRYARISKDGLGRRNFTNVLFAGKRPVRIVIDPGCKLLIKDLQFCKEDPNGKLLKEKNKDGHEVGGHLLQGMEYFFCHPKALGYLAKISK